jgi:GNAT acetyltransferase-like protein
VTAAAEAIVDPDVAATPGRAASAPARGTLFQQPWWLDAVAPGGWSAVRVAHDGEVVGYLPYLNDGFPGFRFSTQPVLTPALGPWVRPTTDDYRHALAHEHEVLTNLLSALPRFDYVLQRCSPTFTNGLPFLWAGFDVRVGYTYRLTQLDDLDRVWSGFETQRRRAVRKAQRTLEVVDGELDALLRLGDLPFHRARMRVPYGCDTVRRIHAACRINDASSLLVARDAGGEPRAALYLVHDDDATYYLLGGQDEVGRASGATTLLLWEGIRRAAARQTLFDFYGSRVESIERFFRSFGARQVPYLVVLRTSTRLRPILPFARMARRVARGWSWRHG